MFEPKLAADLLARGVDDIAFKPVNFGLFGAKVSSLSPAGNGRHHWSLCRHTRVRLQTPSESKAGNIGVEQLEQRLSMLADSLPVMTTADAIVRKIEACSRSIEEVARLVCGDPLLTIRIFQEASRLPDGSPAKRMENLQEAIARIGDRKIIDLVANSPSIESIAKTTLPWLPTHQLCCHCLASGLMMCRLQPTAEIGADDEGLFLASLLLPLSRVLVSLALPDLYRQMIAVCRQTDSSLASVEQRVLPMTPARAIAGTLARWGLSPRMYKPFQHAGDSYREIATITQPLR